MICDNCGHINPNINKTCDNCGKKLEPAPRYPTKTNKSTNRNYEKNEGLFDDIKNLSNEKKIIGVCCLILALIFAVSSVMPYNDVNDLLPADNNSTVYTTDVNNSPEVVEQQAPTKTNTKINVTAKSPVNSGESTTIKGYLTDESNNPLAYYEVQIKIANNEFDVKTSYDGSYTLEFNDTENGSQNVSVRFEETDGYYGCYNNTFFEVTNNTTHNSTNTTNNSTQSNNTTNTHNNTNNTTDNDENKTNDNHDTYNSILSSLLNKHNNNKDNLTNGTNNTTENENRTNNTTNTYNNSSNNIHNNTNHTKNHTNNSTSISNNTNNTTNTHNNTDDNNTYANHSENNTKVENNTTEDKPSKSNTKIDLKIENNIQENQKTNISGTLLDENNLPIQNAIIKIKIDDREYIVHTNSAGEYLLEYTPTTDENIDIEAIYDGDSKHSSSHKSSTIHIN